LLNWKNDFTQPRKPSAMKVGIDLSWLLPGRTGGVETHVRGLLEGLSRVDHENDYVLFATKAVRDTFDSLPANFGFSIIAPRLSSGYSGRLLQQLCIPYHARSTNVAVIHSPANIRCFASERPSVITIHDLNLSFSEIRYYRSRERLTLAKRRVLQHLVRASAARANAIITVSEFSRKCIIEQLGVPPERVSVIHNAPLAFPSNNSVSWPSLAERIGVTRDYVIAFSNGFIHKNIETLIKAFALIPGTHQLVIVGHLPKQSGRVLELIADLNLTGAVRSTGYVKESEMQAILTHATMLAFPSLSEGFGLPILEAMAAGVPVACSNSTALPEVAGDAALYFDPRSTEDIAAALKRICEDPALRKSLIAKGYENIKRFSWTESARKTLEVYRSVA
jgi:glycosyltransferase involved in cell wall biosynthesis